MPPILFHAALWLLSFGLVSLGLIRLNEYSLLSAIMLVLIPGSACSLIISRRATTTEDGTARFRLRGRECALLGAILAGAAALYLLFPTYYLMGGRDHGNYALFSIRAATTGGLNFDQPLFREVSKELGDVVRLAYPALYSEVERSISSDPARLIPQFQHLFPAFGAALHTLFGIEGVFRTNGVISIVALLFLFLLARRLAGPVPALAATVAIALNPAVIWNARAPFTEMLTLWIGTLGTLLLLDSARRPPAAAGLAGAVLGAGVFARLDAGFNAFLVLGGAVHFLFAGGRPRTRHIVATSFAYMMVSAAGFLDSFIHSRPYFDDLWTNGSIKGLLVISFGIAGVALLSGLSSTIRERLTVHRVRKQIHTAALALGGWFFIQFFITGALNHSFNARALQEVTWYVTPLALILIPYAMVRALRHEDWHAWAPLILFFGATAFIYTLSPSIYPDHFWASRRWVPHVVPLTIFFSVFGLKEANGFLARHLPLWQARALSTTIPALTYVLVSVGLSHPFLFKSLLDGYLGQYEDFVARLKANGPVQKYYLTTNRNTASILTYVYGIPSILLDERRLEGYDERKLEGHWFISIDPEENEYEDVVEGMLLASYTERRAGARPRQLSMEWNHLSAGRLVRIERGIW